MEYPRYDTNKSEMTVVLGLEACRAAACRFLSNVVNSDLFRSESGSMADMGASPGLRNYTRAELQGSE